MHIKKGNVLVITIMFTALITFVILGLISGCINNIKISNNNIYKTDLYSIDFSEEEVLRIFMNRINDMELEIDKNKIISEDFLLTEKDSEIYFVKNKNTFYMNYKNENASRKIGYKVRGSKVILIPLYNRIVPKIDGAVKE